MTVALVGVSAALSSVSTAAIVLAGRAAFLLFAQLLASGVVEGLLASLWGDGADVAGILNATSALVAALFAVCVTVYIFLFGELSGGSPRPRGESKVASMLQDEKRKSIEGILWAVIFCIVLNYLGVFARSQVGGNLVVDAAIVVFIALSIILCVRMALFCKGLVDFRGRLCEIACGELESAVDAWAREEGLGGLHAASRAAPPGFDVAYERKAVGALQGLVSQVDDDKALAPEGTQAAQGGGAGRGWVSSEMCFLRYREAESALSGFSDALCSQRGARRRGPVPRGESEEAALCLCGILWGRILASGGEASRPLEYQQFHDLDLSGVRFSQARSRGARFASCNLAGASFDGADLRYGEIFDCTLVGASLAGADCRFLAFRDCDVSRMTLDCEPDGQGRQGEQAAAPDGRHLPLRLSAATRMSCASFDGSSLVAARLVLPSGGCGDAGEPIALSGGDGSPRGLTFDSCSFRDVSFRNSRVENLDMSKTVWTGSNVNYSTFRECDLASSDFSRTAMAEVQLIRCRMGGATLSDGYMGDTRCEGCDLPEATLDHLVVEKSELVGCNLDRASLAGLRVVDSRVQKLRFAHSKGDGPRFIGGSVEDCRFACCSNPGLTFLGVEVRGCGFEGCLLGGSDYSGSRLDGCEFEATTLVEAAFCGAEVVGSSFSGCRLAGASFNCAAVTSCRFAGSSFAGAAFDGASLRDVSFSGVDEPELLAALARVREMEGVTVNGRAVGD